MFRKWTQRFIAVDLTGGKLLFCPKGMAVRQKDRQKTFPTSY